MPRRRTYTLLKHGVACSGARCQPSEHGRGARPRLCSAHLSPLAAAAFALCAFRPRRYPAAAATATAPPVCTQPQLSVPRLRLDPTLCPRQSSPIDQDACAQHLPRARTSPHPQQGTTPAQGPEIPREPNPTAPCPLRRSHTPSLGSLPTP